LAKNAGKPFQVSLEHILGQNVEDPAQVEGGEHEADIGGGLLQ
jgi:hypothetical protein